MTWRPRIRTVLLIVSLAIVALPVGGIAVMRFYNDELIRQTESALIAQGAFVAAAFREALISQRLELLGPDSSLSPENALRDYGLSADPRFEPLYDQKEPLNPIDARLSLTTNAVRPSAPAASEPSAPPDPVAVAAGERITPILTIAKRITLAGIRVVDFRGTVVASTAGEMYQSLALREEVRRALVGENVSLLRVRVSDGAPPPLTSVSRQSRHRVFVALPVREGPRVLGAVVLSRSPMSVYKALYTIRYPALGAAAAVMGVAMLVALLTSFTIARPITALIRQTERVARGEQGAVVALKRPGTHEIRRLSDAFAHMSRTLEERADYIRAFARNVSHEFKTPLTSLRGTVELLHDHIDTMSEEERNRFLTNLEQDTQRLDRLVRRLLELARADVLAPTETRISLPDVLEDLAKRYREAGLNVVLDHGPGVGFVRMTQETLESIVSNLLDNAGQHGGEGVCVTITTQTGGAEMPSFVRIDVADDGPGISPANAAKVFETFFTTARDRGGTGLGLSIARSLLQAQGGGIELLPSDRGATFRITLPE